MKTVALLGGSFNPPHPGHFELAKYIHETLDVDEAWFLFSVNWQKDASQYAPLEDRMEMGRILAQHYPDKPFVMSDIQDELGTHKTYEVLTSLRDRFPDTRFIWTMGADNLASFHTWENYQDIIENFPIAVVKRPPHDDAAQDSLTAQAYKHFMCSDPKALGRQENGWVFLEGLNVEMSSSDLRERLQVGQRQFDGPFQEVADYIHAQNLYGTNNQPDARPTEPNITS